jgi:hypothetical protein
MVLWPVHDEAEVERTRLEVAYSVEGYDPVLRSHCRLAQPGDVEVTVCGRPVRPARIV